MLLTGLLFVGVTAAVKLVGSDIPAPQAAFLRYLLGLVFLLPMLGQLRRARFDRRSVGLFGLRGGVHALGVMLWFFAMTRIPIAEVTAMNYLNPVYVTLGAALFLGEPLAGRRIGAVLVALIGALLILRPGFRELSPGHFAMLGTAALFAVSYLSAKRLSDDWTPGMVVAMLSVTVTIGLAPFAAAVWVAPGPREIALLFVVACLATAGHVTMTMAFRAAPLAVTQPITFLQLVWATLLGWAVFGEALDLWVVAGGSVILAAATFITLREAQLRRRDARRPAP